jgi:hypothetical protein
VAKRTKAPRAELLRKWQAVVAQLKAELRAESSPSLLAMLAGMLKAAKRRGRLADLGESQKAKIAGLTAFVRRVHRETKALHRYERQHPSARGHGQRDAWLEGVHSTLVLFDILLFSPSNDGLVGKAIAALLGRDAGHRAGGINRARKHPGQFSLQEKRRLRALAKELLAKDATLSQAAVCRCVAKAEAQPDPTTFARKLRHVLFPRKSPSQ